VDKASKAGGDNFAFVTSPGRFGFAPTGKFNWRQKNYPDLNLVITKSKHLLAAPDAILIDDDGRQIEAFDKAGGKGFLWPSQYQLRKDDKYLVATYQNLSKLITDVATK
jgi:5'(3')-deoxyribonucleotidase